MGFCRTAASGGLSARWVILGPCRMAVLWDVRACQGLGWFRLLRGDKRLQVAIPAAHSVAHASQGHAGPRESMRCLVKFSGFAARNGPVSQAMKKLRGYRLRQSI